MTSLLWKWNLYDFTCEKRLVGYILNKIIVICFSNPRHFVKMSKFVAGHVTSVIFKIMNYLFLNTNLDLKFQGKCWKDDVVKFTAHLSVTIKLLTRHKQKVVLVAMLEGKSMPNMAANIYSHTNHSTSLKNQSAIKYVR